MRLEQLEYLIEIYHQGSISAASKKLHLSHQALSTSIKSLEDELCLELLIRSPKGVSLTTEGTALVTASKEFINKIDAIISEYTLHHLNGLLTIAGTNLSIEGFLPKAITQFYLKYPQATISSFRLSPSDTLSSFVNNSIDLGFSTLNTTIEKDILEQYPEITFHHCVPFQTGAIVPIDSPLASYKSLSLHQLKSFTIIYNCKESLASDPSNADLFQTIQSRRKIYEPNARIYQELLSNHVGIGITSLSHNKSIGYVPAKTIYLPIRDIEERYFGYFIHKNRPFSSLAQAFLAILENITAI